MVVGVPLCSAEDAFAIPPQDDRLGASTTRQSLANLLCVFGPVFATCPFLQPEQRILDRTKVVKARLPSSGKAFPVRREARLRKIRCSIRENVASCRDHVDATW